MIDDVLAPAGTASASRADAERVQVPETSRHVSAAEGRSPRVIAGMVRPIRSAEALRGQ